jgi:hypothetical protein
MISPAIAAQRLGWSLAVGVALGFWYGFLRPLRGKCRNFADLLFVAAACYGWLYIAFGVCGGDMRFALLVAMAVGGFLWERTVGRLLRPVFGKIWKILLFPGEKFLEICKKLCKMVLAFGKKWVTIEWNRHPRMGSRSGGKPNGKEKKGNQTGAA